MNQNRVRNSVNVNNDFFKKAMIVGSLSIILITIAVIYDGVNPPSNGSGYPVTLAIFVEAFVSLHMTAFVLSPLSKIISEENNKKVFWILFSIRAVILIFFDFFITPAIFFVDFMLLFPEVLIMTPITAIHEKKKQNNNLQTKSVRVVNVNGNIVPLKVPGLDETQITLPNSNSLETNVELRCDKCNGVIKETDKFCQNCGAAISIINASNKQTPTKVIVSSNDYNAIFVQPEKQLVENFVESELEKAGIDKNTDMIPQEVYRRKFILNIILSVLIFLYASLIFFHFPLGTYIIGALIIVILYISTKRFNLVKYIIKQIKARPNEKIRNIVMNTKQNLVNNDKKILTLCFKIIAIIIPLFIFMNPRIFYEKVEEGYAVRFYTFGVTNFKTATIPETYKGENVVSLRGNTFSNMYFLKSVKLPDTITEIRGQTFKNDIMLTSVNIPPRLEYLGGGAFFNAKSITSINLPDTLTYLGGESFKNASSLKEIKLSENISEIRGNTFEGCSSLKSITIPDSITRIGGHAFYDCSSLSEVTISDKSLLFEIGSSAFRRCYKLYSITVPSSTVINSRAFKESPTNINRYESDIYENNYEYNGY